MDKFNLKEYLKNNPLLKENIDFPELEDEFEGTMDAMVVEPEIYLQDIIDDPSVVLGDDYFEVYNAVEDGIYSEEEAVELAKKWATDKLSSLAENKTLNEEVMVDVSLMMGADADKIPAKGKIPFSKFLPLFDKYWRTTGAEGGDSDFITQGLENHVDKGILTDDDVDIAMDMFFGA